MINRGDNETFLCGQIENVNTRFGFKEMDIIIQLWFKILQRNTIVLK